MVTRASTADYITDQLGRLPTISTRKMFGEYALYYRGRVVALICDNHVFIKPTVQGRAYADGYYEESPPYPGGKLWLALDDDKLEDHAWLSELVVLTYENLPPEKSRKK